MYSYYFAVKDKELAQLDEVVLREGSSNLDELVFSFNDTWNNYNEKAIIFMLEEKNYELALIDNKCIVPTEVYFEPLVKVAIIGKKINEMGKIEQLAPTNPVILFVREGVDGEGKEPTHDLPSATEWEQYIQIIEGIAKRAALSEQNCEQIQNDLIILQQNLTQQVLEIEEKLANGDFNGKSAYEIACAHGFVGTEEEWLESLKGNSKSFIYEQEEPAKVWDIQHPLKKKPSIYIEDKDENTLIGTIEYVNDDRVFAFFSEKVAGRAILN